jgi:serine phosphatase RsbU (regulator of sigma subunit)
MIRSRSVQFSRPDELLRELNQFLYEDLTKAELFITLFYLQYHPGKRVIEYASAGHPPTLLWQAAQGQCHRLDPEGLIVGVKKDFPYEKATYSLASGDVLLLFTDGLIEAENDQNELFGEERLASLLKENHQMPPKDLINHIIDQVRLFSSHRNFNDDVSMIVLQAE